MTREERRYRKNRASKRWLRTYQQRHSDDEHRWWIAQFYLCVMNPPSSFGRKWRSETRAVYREEMRKDSDVAQFAPPNKITSKWGWY